MPRLQDEPLGTCKHVLHVLQKLPKKFSAAQLAKPYRRKNISLAVDYRDLLGLRFNLPDKLSEEVEAIVGKVRDQTLTDVNLCMKVVQALERAGTSVNIYPDAEDSSTSCLASSPYQTIGRDPAGSCQASTAQRSP